MSKRTKIGVTHKIFPRDSPSNIRQTFIFPYSNWSELQVLRHRFNLRLVNAVKPDNY